MSEEERDAGAEDDAVSLLRLAGARPSPPAERVADARAHVHAAWRAGIRRRRARTAALAAAAGLAAVALPLAAHRSFQAGPETARPPVEAAAAIARLEVADGVVERLGASGWVPLAAGEPLPAGSSVRTGARGAGFGADHGRSVRMGPRSRLRWETGDRLALESGAVYVDSGPGAGPSSPLEVRTAWGTVRETGTQFEVRMEPTALRVRVREGRVAVLGGGPTQDVASGTELRVGTRGVTRRAVAVHGPEWSWVLALAPTFEIEGQPLHGLLAWAAREAGWELRYADAESRRRAESALLHGSIRGMSPEEAVGTVAPSTGLPCRLQEGVLRVGPADAAGGA